MAFPPQLAEELNELMHRQDELKDERGARAPTMRTTLLFQMDVVNLFHRLSKHWRQEHYRIAVETDRTVGRLATVDEPNPHLLPSLMKRINTRRKGKLVMAKHEGILRRHTRIRGALAQNLTERMQTAASKMAVLLEIQVEAAATLWDEAKEWHKNVEADQLNLDQQTKLYETKQKNEHTR